MSISTERPVPAPRAGRRPGEASVFTGSAVGIIWLAAAAVALFAPDMITGSQHEHLPIAGITVWIWAVVATAYLLLGARRSRSIGTLIGTGAIWLITAVAAIAAPVMVTGSDPTRIPLGAILVPLLAAIATGFLALHEATATAAP